VIAYSEEPLSQEDSAELGAKHRMEERALNAKQKMVHAGISPNNYEPPTSGHEFKIADKIGSKFPKAIRNLSSFWTRFLVGSIYFVLVLVSFYFGRTPTMIVLCLIAAIASQEFYFLVRSESRLPNELIGCIGSVAYVPAMNYFGLRGCAWVTLLLLLVLLVWYVFWMKAKISDVGVSLFGAVYTGGFLSGFMYVSAYVAPPYNSWALIIIFISVCANDSFAFLVGRAIGKHKLAPRTSPNKTWEGFIAGIVGCAAFWAIFAYLPGVMLPLPLAIFFGVVSALLQVLGDLAESRIKRNAGFKDSGWIMPGHGGLLDRCDSLFLASVSAVIMFIAAGVIPLA
jgi:phosphatidate cytidylyltransferase